MWKTEERCWPVRVTGGCHGHPLRCNECPGTSQGTQGIKYLTKCMPAVHRTDPQYLVNITQGRIILLKMTRVPLWSHTGSLISYCRDTVRCPGVSGQSAHLLQRCKLLISGGIALHSCLVQHYWTILPYTEAIPVLWCSF